MKENDVSKLIDENYNVRLVDDYRPEVYTKKCYNLGFLDGYMNEEIYREMINQDDGIASYERGFKKGRTVRDNCSTKELIKNKEYFLARFAFYDGINGLVNEKLSDDAKEIYDRYYAGEYNLRTGNYSPKDKIK